MSRPRSTDKSAPYQPVSMAAEISGLSKKYIYEGCKNGTIAHVKVGTNYRIFMPDLMLRPATRLTSDEINGKWVALQTELQHALMFFRTKHYEIQREYKNIWEHTGGARAGYSMGLIESYSVIIDYLERWLGS